MHKRLRDRKRGIEGMKLWKLETLIEIGQKKKEKIWGCRKKKKKKKMNEK